MFFKNLFKRKSREDMRIKERDDIMKTHGIPESKRKKFRENSWEKMREQVTPEQREARRKYIEDYFRNNPAKRSKNDDA